MIQGQEANKSIPLGGVVKRIREWFTGNF